MMELCTRLRCVAMGAVLCVLAGASSCQANSLVLGVEDDVLQRGHAIFQDQTCIRTDTYGVVTGDLPMDLCIRIGLKSGTLDWQILGPNGQDYRGSGDATEGEIYHLNYCAAVVPGDWYFVLDMRDASGEYDVAWSVPDTLPSVATRMKRGGE